MPHLHMPIGRIGKAGINQSFFKPTNIANLLVWLDATDFSTITESGSSVSEWSDKSGNNNHAAQGNITVRPVLSGNEINGKPCMIQNGAGNSFMTIDDFSFSSMTAFVVLRNERSYPSADLILDQIFRHNGSPPKNLSSFNGYIGSDDNPSIRAEHINGNLYINGVSKSNNDQFSANVDVIFSLDSSESVLSSFLDILGKNSSQWAHTGPIGEIIIYDRVLGNIEHNRVGRYLSQKWGIAWSDIV